MNAIVVAVGTWAAKAGARLARLFGARRILDSVPKPDPKKAAKRVETKRAAFLAEAESLTGFWMPAGTPVSINGIPFRLKRRSNLEGVPGNLRSAGIELED